MPVGAAAELPGSLYTALATPQRILDTRTDVGGHPLRVGPGETVTLPVPGLPDSATAVVLNLTGVDGTQYTFLSAFPNQFVGTSTLNLAPGQVAAVSAFVTLGQGKQVKIYNHNGDVHVVADMIGYFATGTGAGFTSTAAPSRVLDTRTELGGHLGRLGSDEVLTLPIRGIAGVPTDATAVVINLTAVTPTGESYLAATPGGLPGTSTLNLPAGAIRANLAVVGIGGDGAIRLRGFGGSMDVVADVQGWFGPSEGGRYVPLAAPNRVMDTRTAVGPIAPTGTLPVSFAGTDVPAEGRVSVLFTLTGVDPTTVTYLTAWPQGQPRPVASNVNLSPGTVAPNTAIIDSAAVNIYNLDGATHAIVDAAGYFYAPSHPNPTAPGAPTVTTVWDAGDRTGVAWSKPDDGGLPITGYKITAQPGGLTVTVAADRREIAIAGLHPDVSYTLTVAAANAIGTGQASAPSGLVSPSRFTRADTDPTGTPEPTSDALVDDVSGNGRYALITVPSNSPLTPAAYRTPGPAGRLLIRKDLQTGEIVLAGVRPDGGPATTATGSISQDGTKVAYTTQPESGLAGLYVRDLVARTIQSIPVPADRAPHDAHLSADGKLLSWTIDQDRSSSSVLHRVDLTTGTAKVVLSCENPSTGCYLATKPSVADNGKTYLIDYRATPADPVRLTLLDADTGQLRALPEGGQGDGFTLSGDGKWAVYSIGESGSHHLKKVSTAPGAAPVTLRTWTDDVTLTVSPVAISGDGGRIGFFRQTDEPGQWNFATRGYLYDQPSGREVPMPAPRDGAYLGGPMISHDGSTAITREHCRSSVNCYPVGDYFLSLPELLR